MTSCSFTGCERAATHAVRLIVPAMGWPEAVHQPLSVIIGVALCREHAEGFDVGKVVNEPGGEEPTMRETIARLVRTQGKVAPDFSRARGEPLRLDSPEYLQFERMGAGRAH